MSRQTILRQLVKATEVMVQGGLSETTRTCGNKNCACHRDPSRRHGPHLYLTFRSEGRSCSLYVPPEQSAAVKDAQAAWARFWELGCKLAALNRDRLRREFKRVRNTSSVGDRRKGRD